LRGAGREGSLPLPRHAIRETGSAHASASGIPTTHAFSTLVRRTFQNRLRLLAVALAGVVAGVLVGYLLLSITILRWSER
jgi:hypothetical protein